MGIDDQQRTIDAINRSYRKLQDGAPLHEQIYWENRRFEAIRRLSGEDRIRTCGTKEAEECR
jgi:hypothetical protein